MYLLTWSIGQHAKYGKPQPVIVDRSPAITNSDGLSKSGVGFVILAPLQICRNPSKAQYETFEDEYDRWMNARHMELSATTNTVILGSLLV